jgi:hypothetical protein
LHNLDNLPASVRESATMSKREHYKVLHFKEAEYGFGVDRCQPVWDRPKTPRRTDEIARGDSAGQLDASLLGPYTAEDVARDEKLRVSVHCDRCHSRARLKHIILTLSTVVADERSVQ